MPQSLVFSNGNLLINLGADAQMRDVYFPHVGQENHTGFGAMHRVGVWVDGQFAWLGDDGWALHMHYKPNTLVGDTTATHDALQLTLQFEDFVYTTHDLFFRRVQVTNLAEHDREIRLFFAHDFYLYGDKQQDTAQYEPDLHGVLHYRQQRYFFVSGQWADSNETLSEFSVGKSGYQDKEGTWRDAEDGHLHGNPIEQGSVDSCIGFYGTVTAGATRRLDVWLAAGQNFGEVCALHSRVLVMGPARIADHTREYWAQWVTKHNVHLNGVEDNVADLFHRSLLMVRTQTDNRGAIIASNDSDIMKFNKDTYTYMWPRDGALVSLTLSRCGYFAVVERFLRFCANVVTEHGYVLHKFTPDGALGSSWHPKWKNGQKQLPIQEDESALILVALWEYYAQSKNVEVVQELFNGVVLRVGRFLMQYIDPTTGLPKPSYDLWEEQRGVFSYTCACTVAGLRAAAKLSRVTGHYHDAEQFATAAETMATAVIEHLYSEQHGRFLKRLIVNPDGSYAPDARVDASLAFVFEMGLLPADDPRVVRTMQAIVDTLSVQTDVGGIARYEGDMYHRNWNQQYSRTIVGNPWIITTLWVANWHIARADSDTDLERAYALIRWAAAQANDAGILPEQMDPFNGEPLSVAPLTWSHATFADTVMRYSRAIAGRS